MRLVCDSCKTKYSIADEKVRGKVFKIRCKKCQHVIVVRGLDGQGGHAAGDGAAVEARSGAPEPAAGGVEAAEQAQGQGQGQGQVEEERDTRVFNYGDYRDAAAMMHGAEGEDGGAAEVFPPVWHLVIDGEQAGPFGEGEVRERLIRGEVGPDTFIWRDGFSDWQRISAVTEFSGASVPQTDVAQDRAYFPPVAAEDPALAGDDGRLPAFLAPPTNVAEEPLFAASEGGGASPKLTAARNENSVLFSLSDLQNVARSGGGAPRISVLSSSSESSGLVDIREMAASVPKDSEEDSLVQAFSGFSAPAAGPVLLAPQNAGLPRWVWPAVGLAGGTLVILVVVLLVAVWQRTSVAPPVAAVPAVQPASLPTAVPTTPAAAAPRGTAPIPAVAPAATTTTTPASASASGDSTKPVSKPDGANAVKKPKPATTTRPPAPSGPTPAAPAPTPAPKGGDELDSLLNKALGGTVPAPGPKPRSGPTPQAVDKDLPAMLNKIQIQKGMAAAKQRVQTCYEQYRVPGAINVQITIDSSGRLLNSKVTGKFAGTPTGTCVEKAVKSARFDAFSGPNMVLNYPYTLPIP